MLLDIRPDHLHLVQEILRNHVPDHDVWAFGSRAKWTARDTSDLDLCIVGNVPLGFKLLGQLRDVFSESNLPYKVDVVDWATTSESFRKIIEQDKVVVQKPIVGRVSASVTRQTADEAKDDVGLRDKAANPTNGNLGMTSEWSEVMLGDLFKVKHGFAFKGEYFTDEPQRAALVTPGNFAIGGGFQDGKRKYYRGPVPADYVLPPGQIVVTMTDLSKQSDTLGYAAKIPEGTNAWLHNQRVGLLVFNPEFSAVPQFVEYLLRSHGYRAWVVGSATGTTVKHTSPSRIESYKTRVPPPDEQRAIAHILGTLDDKIELNRRRNVTLEAMARALFQDWFVGFGPIRAKLEGRTPYLPTDLWNRFPDRLDDDGNPEGWEEKPLDEIAEFLNGLALQKFPATDLDDSLPVIKIAELRNGVSPKTDRASREVPARYIVKDGDFLFSWSGSLLAKFWTEGEGALNQHLFKVSSNQYPMWFVSHWVHHHLEEFQAIAASKATTMGHIQRGHLKAAMTLCPPDDVLEMMGATIAPLIEQTIQNELESRTLAQLRDTLLPKLISGELRIADAARLAERVI